MRSESVVHRALLSAVLLSLTGASTRALPSQSDCATPYDCAVLQVQRQEFAPAIRALEQIVAASPRNLRALNLLGIALTGIGRRDDANARFRAALVIDPQFVPALKNLGVNEFTAGRMDQAKQHFASVLKQAPDDEIAHLHLGEILFQRSDYASALAHYEKAGDRVASNPAWSLHKATSLLGLGRRPDAVALLDRLPADDSNAAFDAGTALGRFGARAEAARFFGLARTSGYKDAYAAGYNQTLMLIEAGENEAAIQVAQELFGQGIKPAELYNLVSRAYARSDRIKEAYDALREATRIEPAVAEHYIDLAMLCLEHENYDLALEIVDIGLKHRPESSMLYLQRGVVLAMKGSVEQAQEEFTRASRAAPDEPAPYVALAMVWMQRGQTPKAIDLLRTRSRATARNPQPAILYALGIALLRSGAAADDPGGTEALHAFSTAVRLQPSFVQAQAELGKLLLKRGDVTNAIAHLERAMVLEPSNAAPAYVLAQAYRRGGQTDRARDLLERVSRLNAQERGDDPDTDLRRMMFRIVRAEGSSTTASSEASPATAEACAAAGDMDGAIEQLRRLLLSSSSSPERRYQLAVVLWNRYQHAGGRRQKADLDDAVTILLPAVEQNPDQPQLQLVLGQMLAEQQDLASSVQHLRKAVALAPDNPEPAYNLGLALRLQGDLDAAEAQFRAALAKDGGHALARRSLGLVLRQKGDTTAAATELRRAVADRSDDAEARHVLGATLLRLGDVAGAIVELRESVRLDPQLTEARVLLAQALSKQGHREEAVREQREVQRINAEKADFGRMLVLLDSSAALLKNGDIKEAIAQRREASALAPGFAEVHYELGLALRAADASSAEAEAAFRQAIALEPAYARAYSALGDVLEKRGDGAGARAARVRASALAPCSEAGRYN
jgi:tetratricopeptide (TPR) repeat protein